MRRIKPAIHSKAVGSKVLREEVIPALRKEIKYLKEQLWNKQQQNVKYRVRGSVKEKEAEKLENKLVRVRKGNANLRVKRQNLRNKIARLAPSPVLSSAAKLKRHCEAYYADKVFDTSVTPSFFASLLGYHYVKDWIKNSGFTERELMLVVIIYHHKWFVRKDALKWGYKANPFFLYVKRLKEKDLVYQYVQGNNRRYYSISPKGKELIRSYETFYNKEVAKMIKNRPDNTPDMKLVKSASWKNRI